MTKLFYGKKLSLAILMWITMLIGIFTINHWETYLPIIDAETVLVVLGVLGVGCLIEHLKEKDMLTKIIEAL